MARRQEDLLDGWILGLSDGYTRRANSVNPIYDGVRNVPDKIPLCEEAYAEHGLSAVFKVTPMAVRMGLDELLAKQRYEKKATTRVQILTLNAASEAVDHDVEVLEGASQDWMIDYRDLKRMTEEETAKNRTILDRIGLPKRFVILKQNGKRVAAGIAVVESGWVGLFGIVSDPEKRRLGLSRRLTGALAEVGRQAGASTAYLQVEADNSPALRFYASMGFQDVYSYWYREKNTHAL